MADRGHRHPPSDRGRADRAALDADGGVPPGVHEITIAGFNGHPEPGFGQGKQIFNPWKTKDTVPEGTSTKDFTVPDSQGENVRIEPTSDK